MGWRADKLCSEDNRLNGYRERKLATMPGEITMLVLQLREGAYYPDELASPCSRADRAIVAVVKETSVCELSTHKIEKTAEVLGFGFLGPSRISRMTSEFDEEVASLNARHFDGALFP